MESKTIETQGAARSVEEEPEQRAFRRYFEQITAVSQALSDLRRAYAEPRWAEYFARSVRCAWAVLEARRAQLEFVTGNGSLSYPGLRYIRDRTSEVIREGWTRVSQDAVVGHVLAEQLRRLEDCLTMPPLCAITEAIWTHP